MSQIVKYQNVQLQMRYLLRANIKIAKLLTMQRIEFFIKKIQTSPNKFQKICLQQQQLLQPLPFIQPRDTYKHNINAKYYEQLIQAQQNISQFTLCDILKGLRQEESVSYLFEKREPLYASKLAKIFKRRKRQQIIQLNSIKQAIIRQFGEVGEQFDWKVKKEEFMGINGPKISNKLIQKKNYFLKNIERNDSAEFTLVQQDYRRLLPGMDLNDALIDSYFKIMKAFILTQETNKVSFIFSTYLLQKLIFKIQQLIQHNHVIYTSDQCVQLTKQEVRKNYDKVQRWNRKIDIFDKRILVFPINMFGHWFCVMVLNPGSLILQDQQAQDKCTIVFCDSMFEQRFFVVEAIREYLSLQLQCKRNLKINVTQHNSPSFQFILPRQSNQHDCGLYMLAYIQELLLNHQLHFSELHDIQMWNKLRYFPRKFMYSLRQRLMKLLTELYYKQSSAEKINQIIQAYIKQKEKIYQQAQRTQDYDVIDQQDFQRYLILMQFQANNKEAQLQRYRYLVKFSLSQDVNYVQKDAVSEQDEFQSEEYSEYI